MRLGSGAFAASCVAIEVIGVAIFIRGFFPAPVRSSARPEHGAETPAPEPVAGVSSNWTKLPPPLFSKVVIMLIDALRDDFVFGSKGVKYMPYTTYLVEKGASHSFVAEAKPPTVTMPRIKALMTGSLPGFVDVIRNLNSPVLLEDNVIRQAKAAGKRIIFYGDETWVKLFPKHFVEYDGTTSFFVSDYIEVDNNVTRHLDKVLRRGDWDVLILHYLGLDHIGHISGPNSPLIGHKLSEMDSVLMKIHTSLLSKDRETLLPSLLVLCGDHGMSETGSHGASSTEEVSTPLLLISSAFERKPGDVRHPKHVQQTDLAATLAIGLGLPIPKDNVGSLLFPVIEGKQMREQLRFLHLNTLQLSKLLQENIPAYEKDPGFEQFKMAERLHGNWVKLHLEENHSDILLGLGTKVLRQYLGALKTLSQSLSTQVAHYDIYSMAVGTLMVLEVLTLFLLSTPHVLCRKAELDVPLLSPVFSLLFYLIFLVLSAIHVLVCTSSESSCYLCNLPWLAAGAVMVLVSALFCAILSALIRMVTDGTLLRKNATVASSGWSEVNLLLLLGTVGHVLSLGASSFVEEEHQTWYFLINTLCLALSQETCRSYFLGDDCEPQHHFQVEQKCVNVLACTLQDSTSCSTPESESDTAGKRASLLEAHRSCKWWTVLASPWLVLICCRLLRSLNQTGVQGAHRPDFSHWLTSSDHKVHLSGLAALSLVVIFILVQKGCSLVSKVALALGLLGVFCYRAAIGIVLFPWQPDNKGISNGSALSRACFCYALICSVPVATYIVLVTSLRYHLFIWSVFSPKLLYEGMHLLITAAICAVFTATNQTRHSRA
ncbi:GPI ethanolamine phosphate transferase 2 isoform X4 [Rattus norvegicus]|uniref:GPI ethanolamine phosphate transferase 2 isoform X4 n=1 Tax=Rattus norvegicus TaxID=10116 RepID=UPI0003D0A17D|nr:GPI ethanolamine phosphate transferase 2 isoform X5 [Rattus norvegicus]|eukprot:XP_006250579.1 PREDICTED: GPI ethanolamine phosphate transferase 2-like isoform X5 [Rattus norvegicus]